MKRTLKVMAAALVISLCLFVGAGIVTGPVGAVAASVRRVSKKKRSKRYFTRTGFDWDNHYLQAGKKEDLSRLFFAESVKAASGTFR